MKTIYLTTCYGETRGALIDKDWLTEFFLERSTAPSLHDAIFCGRVVEHHKAMGWAIVDLGEERQGFITAKKPHTLPAIGEKVLVQSLDHGISPGDEHQLLKLTTQISLGNSLLVFMPNKSDIQISAGAKGSGAIPEFLIPTLEDTDFFGIVRQAALTASPKTLTHNVTTLKALWQTIQTAFTQAKTPLLLHKPLGWLKWLRGLGPIDELIVDHGLLNGALVQELQLTLPQLDVQHMAYGQSSFFEELEDAWSTLLDQTFHLPDGGRLHIYETPAATLIDVDSAQAQGTDPEQVHFRVNLNAANEVFRQMRLRQMKGIIIVDFITLKSPGLRKQLEQKLKSLAKQDPTGVHFHGLSALGLAEIVRESRVPPLSQRLLTTPQTQPSLETIAFQVLRTAARLPADKPILIEAHPDILALFQSKLQPNFLDFEAQRAALVTIRPMQTRDVVNFTVT